MRKTIKQFILFSLFILLVFAPNISIYAIEGDVTELPGINKGGKVAIKPREDSPTVDAKIGARIYENGIIYTGPGKESKAELLVTNENEKALIRVGSNTYLKLNPSSKQIKLLLEEGKILVKTKDCMNLNVYVGNYVAATEGTTFEVRVLRPEDDDSTDEAGLNDIENENPDVDNETVEPETVDDETVEIESIEIKPNITEEPLECETENTETEAAQQAEPECEESDLSEKEIIEVNTGETKVLEENDLDIEPVKAVTEDSDNLEPDTVEAEISVYDGAIRLEDPENKNVKPIRIKKGQRIKLFFKGVKEINKLKRQYNKDIRQLKRETFKAKVKEIREMKRSPEFRALNMWQRAKVINSIKKKYNKQFWTDFRLTRAEFLTLRKDIKDQFFNPKSLQFK